MSEKTSMNQGTVKVILKAPDENKDVLLFVFADKELEVNLNSDQCQSELKKIFIHLLKELMEADINLAFSIEEGYNRMFYVEACEEYIKDLNRELNSIKQTIRDELSISN